MPRFFFHLIDENQRFVDTQGQECDDLVSAKAYAVSRARNQLVEQMLQGNDDPDGRHFEVEDDRGQKLLDVRLKDLLPPQMKG